MLPADVVDVDVGDVAVDVDVLFCRILIQIF